MLGARNGIVTPTAEPISGTAMTPFGLTLRTTPTPRKVVRVRSADGVITMSTDKVTTYETDGSEDGSDTQSGLHHRLRELLVDAMHLEPDPAANTVLVLTEPGDTTADLVVNELDHRGAQVFRTDTGDLVASA